MQYKDYYDVLGVDRGADVAEIKKAYRRLARKYHPDVSKERDAEERIKEINEAWDVLGNDDKRRAYDELGHNWKAGQEFRPPPDWSGSTDGMDVDDLDAFSEFFKAIFGDRRFSEGGAQGFHRRGFAGGPGRHYQTKGADQHGGVSVSLEEAFRGARRKLRLNSDRTIEVRIPKGVIHGQRIRLTGQGAPGVGGGPSGDLYLEVTIADHRRFRLDGRDVLLELPIAPWEAALGATVRTPTLGGNVTVKVPAGSQTGRKLRLKGKGLPGPTVGDQYVILQIVTPPANDEAARACYRRMSEEMPFEPRADFEVETAG